MAYNNDERLAEELLARRGFVHDPTGQYSDYLRHRLESLDEVPVPSGYRFVTVPDLADLELRAEVHRRLRPL